MTGYIHTESSHVVTAANGQETNKRNLHARQSPEGIPRRVADIQTRAVAAHADKHKNVQRNQVGNKNISTPCRHHVAVEQGSQRPPHDGSILDCLDPEVEGEDQEEDGDSLIIVTSGDRSRDISRGNSHESGCQQTGRGGRRHLVGQEVRCQCSQAREGRGEQHTDVANIDGNSNRAQEVPDSTAGDHQSGVERSSSDTA